MRDIPIVLDSDSDSDSLDETIFIDSDSDKAEEPKAVADSPLKVFEGQKYRLVISGFESHALGLQYGVWVLHICVVIYLLEKGNCCQVLDLHFSVIGKFYRFWTRYRLSKLIVVRLSILDVITACIMNAICAEEPDIRVQTSTKRLKFRFVTKTRLFMHLHVQS